MNKADRNEEIEKLQKQLKYSFKNSELLNEALTHSSYANESGTSFFNERLEYLGDAVLELVSSEKLFIEEKDLNEGKLTLLRSKMVCKNSLCSWGRKIGLDRAVRIGKSLRKTGVTDSVCADATEAVFGAVFLDSGYEKAKEVILSFLESQKDVSPENLDPKTELQQLLQAKGLGVPYYVTVDRKGPEHALRFRVNMTLNNKVITDAWGTSIKDAEFKAAEKVLKENLLKLK